MLKIRCFTDKTAESKDEKEVVQIGLDDGQIREAATFANPSDAAAFAAGIRWHRDFLVAQSHGESTEGAPVA